MADSFISAKSRLVSVHTKHGVVMLSGSVPTKEDRERIIKIAGNIHGVKKVKSKIVIDKPDCKK